MKKVAFIIPPTVELLDLAGPVQVFTEAKFYGFEIEIEFFQFQEKPVSTSGLGFGKIASFKDAKLKEGDFVFVPGIYCTFFPLYIALVVMPVLISIPTPRAP